MRDRIFMMALFVTVNACNGETIPSEPKQETKPAQVESAAEMADVEDLTDQPALAPDEPTTKLGAMPIAEDLEEEADRVIVQDNLEAELDRIEMEITD